METAFLCGSPPEGGSPVSVCFLTAWMTGCKDLSVWHVFGAE